MTSKERSLMWESIWAGLLIPTFRKSTFIVSNVCKQADKKILIHKGQRLNIVFLLTIAFSLICLILTHYQSHTKSRYIVACNGKIMPA